MIKRQTKILSAIIAVALCVVIVFALFYFQVFELSDSQLQDKLFIQEKITNEVVLIGIDDQSIQKFGEWPWNRAQHAQMIEKLERADVKAIGYDVTFSEQGNGDEEFFASVAKYNNLIFPMEGTLALKKFQYAEFEETLWPVAQIRDHAFIGHSVLMQDNDGKVRRMPFYVQNEKDIIAPFFAGVLEKAGHLEDAFDFDLDFYDFDDYNLFRIKFFGPGKTFIQYSFAEVLADDFDDALLKNKIVLVGAVAQNLHDEYFTASTKGSAMSGVEVQANLIESVLQGKVVQQVDNAWYYLLLFAVLGAIAGWCAFIRKIYIALPLLVVILFVYLFAVSIVFVFGFVISILYPVGLVILIYAIAFLVRYLLASKGKQKLRLAFSQYVAKEVVDELIADPSKVKLGGERRELTILFSDIRGFTSLSEKMQPEELVHYLNDYLSAMTEVVLTHRGVVDKFIGDAVMALWGAPLENEHHAKDAVLTALLMHHALDEFNARKKGEVPSLDKLGTSYARDDIEIKIGIGLNTGEVVVGNLGSHQRFDYTAIGDAVNLASRLESLTKFYGVKIIISEKTRIQLDAEFVTQYLDKVAVKGKKEGVKIYQVLGLIEEKAEHAVLIKDFDKAIKFYLAENWHRAKDEFEMLREKYPEQRLPDIYLDRLKMYLKNPPKDFDGVFRAEFK